MKKFLPVIIFLLVQLQLNQLFAQQIKRCGTVEYMQKQIQDDPSYALRLKQNEELVQQLAAQQLIPGNNRTVITVPVVFHVLYHTIAQNISQNRIQDQLATLNKDYGRYNADTNNTPVAFRSVSANTNIQFCLAQRDPNGNWTDGIVRVSTTATGFDPLSNDNMKHSANGGDDAWPRDQYLNIWIGNFNGSSSQLLGISQLPGGNAALDGCCVLYTTVGGVTYHGTEPSYNLGRTLTHEVGHWFGLRHVWGDDGSACSGSDYVNDTPNQSSENYGCPTFPHTDNCTAVSPGVMFMNYMDYVDDNCMNMFTTGQATRMNNYLNGTRVAIVTSDGCETATGIEQTRSIATDFSVFPNPSSGIFNLKCELSAKKDVLIQVTDLIGKTVFQREIKNALYIGQPIDLSEFSPGVYNLQLRTTDGIMNKKISLTR